VTRFEWACPVEQSRKRRSVDLAGPPRSEKNRAQSAIQRMYGSVAFGRSTMKAGLVFLVIPRISWLLIAAPVVLAVNTRSCCRV